MEKNWAERAKSLLEDDFFIDFDEPTKEEFVPADTADLKESFYRDNYDMAKDKISEEELYKALVDAGELVSLNAGDTGETVSFKDGGRYSDTTYEITEYDGKFSVTEFHNSDDGDWKEGDYYFETDSFETLCAELQRIFPNALIECKITEDVNLEEHDLAFYVRDSISHLVNDLGMDSSEEGFADRVVKDIEDNYDIDVPADMKAYTNWCSEIMCEVSRQLNMTEDFKEPDNAVVDYKVNKAISEMSTDEKVELANKLFTSIAEKKLFGPNFDYAQITGRNALTSAEVEDYVYDKNCFLVNIILAAERDFYGVRGEADEDEDGWYTYYNFDDVEYEAVKLLDLDNGEVEVDGYYVTLQDTDDFEKEDYEITESDDGWCAGVAWGGATSTFSIEAIDNIE